MKFDVRGFFENMPRKCKFQYNLTKITGTLHDDLRKFMVISRTILLTMRNFLDKFVAKINTNILRPIKLLRKSFQRWQYGACALHSGSVRQ